jgi:hypothetical protein
MSTPISSLPPAFQALEARLADLQARYRRSEIDASRYQAEVQALTLQDEAGRTWWLGGEAGAWHIWDGTRWVRSAPPVGFQPSVPAVASKPKRTGRPMILGCGLGVLIVIVLAAVFLIIGWQAYQQEPMIVDGVEPNDLALSQYSLSSDQQNMIDQLGYPEAFAILFYEEEQVDGSFMDVRFETWSYYTSGVEYTFINGVQEAEDPLEFGLVGDLIPIPYQPEQFVAFMSLDEVIASAGLETYMVIPLEKEIVEDGEVYYADELTFGLKNDELRYVEALAVELEE